MGRGVGCGVDNNFFVVLIKNYLDQRKFSLAEKLSLKDTSSKNSNFVNFGYFKQKKKPKIFLIVKSAKNLQEKAIF